MKKAFLAVASLGLLAVAACKKEYYSTSTNPTTVVNTTAFTPSYRVDGIRDVVLQKVDSGFTPDTTVMPLTISYGNKNQERVRLSLEGVPATVRDSITVTSGYPTFNSSLVFSDSGVAAGTYPVKLVVTGDSSGRREFAFDMKVLLAPDCSGSIVDTGYNAQSQNCIGAGVTYTVKIEPSTTRGEVRFVNFDNIGGSLRVVVQCNPNLPGTGLLVVPTQTVNGTQYNGGSGSYDVRFGSKSISLIAQVPTAPGGVCDLSLNK